MTSIFRVATASDTVESSPPERIATPFMAEDYRGAGSLKPEAGRKFEVGSSKLEFGGPKAKASPTFRLLTSSRDALLHRHCPSGSGARAPRTRPGGAPARGCGRQMGRGGEPPSLDEVPGERDGRAGRAAHGAPDDRGGALAGDEADL